MKSPSHSSQFFPLVWPSPKVIGESCGFLWSLSSAPPLKPRLSPATVRAESSSVQALIPRLYSSNPLIHWRVCILWDRLGLTCYSQQKKPSLQPSLDGSPSQQANPPGHIPFPGCWWGGLGSLAGRAHIAQRDQKGMWFPEGFQQGHGNRLWSRAGSTSLLRSTSNPPWSPM